MNRTSPTLTELLVDAADAIEHNALVLRQTNTIRGRYHRDALGRAAKAQYQIDMQLVRHLRRAERYWARNPLGGPAKVFDAMADCLRAGEPYQDVLRDYGFRSVRTPKRIRRSAKK